VVLNLNLNNLDDEGQESTNLTPVKEDKQIESDVKEVSTEEYDMKYYRTNYILK
jgi:hypothetical protein